MINVKEFEKLVYSAHNFFEIFEGRYDAYPIALRCTKEWLRNSEFEISNEDRIKVENLFKTFNIDAFRNKRDDLEKYDDSWKNIVEKVKEQMQELLEIFEAGEHENIGIALAPYLFTWNFQRFKEYIKKNKDFSVKSYFNELGKICKNVKNELLHFHQLKLTENEIEEKRIRSVFNNLNRELRNIGIGNNEPVAVIKILHIFAPYYFPLADNKILNAFGLGSPSSTVYINWMKRIQNWLKNFSQSNLHLITHLEKATNSSILKLIDELFYVMVTVKLKYRVNLLGL